MLIAASREEQTTRPSWWYGSRAGAVNVACKEVVESFSGGFRGGSGETWKMGGILENNGKESV